MAKAVKLVEFREERSWSQVQMAEELSRFAGKPLSSRTLGYWEQGVMPRRSWLGIIKDFTKGKVNADSFQATPYTHPHGLTREENAQAPA